MVPISALNLCGADLQASVDRTLVLSDGERMFAATEMVAGGEEAFEAMKVDQLKVELAERGSTRSGRKAILQRRLHTLLVQAAIERHRENMDI